MLLNKKVDKFERCLKTPTSLFPFSCVTFHSYQPSLNKFLGANTPYYFGWVDINPSDNRIVPTDIGIAKYHEAIKTDVRRENKDVNRCRATQQNNAVGGNQPI